MKALECVQGRWVVEHTFHVGTPLQRIGAGFYNVGGGHFCAVTAPGYCVRGCNNMTGQRRRRGWINGQRVKHQSISLFPHSATAAHPRALRNNGQGQRVSLTVRLQVVLGEGVQPDAGARGRTQVKAARRGRFHGAQRIGRGG